MESASGSAAMIRRVPIRMRRADVGVRYSKAARVEIGDNFRDEGHMRYYAASVRCGGKEEEKRRMKLVRSLEKDLSALCTVGAEKGDLMAGEIKGQMISEAAELLLSQLKQLRAEAKEMKKKRKQEKKAAKKIAKMKDESSSSSSESSDSECETTVKISSLRKVETVHPEEETRPDYNSNLMGTLKGDIQEDIVAEMVMKPMDKIEVCIREDIVAVAEMVVKPTDNMEVCMGGKLLKSNIQEEDIVVEMVVKPMDKIEVCMGGKCKKSGAMELLAEFERRVGTGGAVIGSKCMGKCRNGPNVRVVNSSGDRGASVDVPSNPLCIGVGLEDVSSIVDNFWGEDKDAGLLPIL